MFSLHFLSCFFLSCIDFKKIQYSHTQRSYQTHVGIVSEKFPRAFWICPLRGSVAEIMIVLYAAPLSADLFQLMDS